MSVPDAALLASLQGRTSGLSSPAYPKILITRVTAFHILTVTPGMAPVQCPACSHADSKVTDSRTADGAIRRRRACLACGERFTTYERVGVAGVLVAKRDGRRE